MAWIWVFGNTKYCVHSIVVLELWIIFGNLSIVSLITWLLEYLVNIKRQKKKPTGLFKTNCSLDWNIEFIRFLSLTA